MRKLHHMGGTFNFKGCPILFETPVTETGHPKSLKSATKIMWRSRLKVDRRAMSSKKSVLPSSIQNIYMNMTNTCFRFQKFSNFFGGWRKVKSHTFIYIKRQTKKTKLEGLWWCLSSKTNAIHCCLRLSE